MRGFETTPEKIPEKSLEELTMKDFLRGQVDVENTGTVLIVGSNTPKIETITTDTLLPYQLERLVFEEDIHI